MKDRLDRVLVARGLADDLHRARALTMRGLVWVDGRRADKAGTEVSPESSIEVKSPGRRFVSRAGAKLEGALAVFDLDVAGAVCLDLGASTGGFTDCLLQRGARKVYAFDVGKGLLDWSLQKDARVVARENFNVRFIRPDDVPDRVELAVIDLSFISLKKVLPALQAFSPLQVVALVKPQFEAARSEVEPGGLVTEKTVQRRVLDQLRCFASDLGFECLAEVPAGVRGRKGNQEFFLHLRIGAART